MGTGCTGKTEIDFRKLNLKQVEKLLVKCQIFISFREDKNLSKTDSTAGPFVPMKVHLKGAYLQYIYF